MGKGVSKFSGLFQNEAHGDARGLNDGHVLAYVAAEPAVENEPWPLALVFSAQLWPPKST